MKYWIIMLAVLLLAACKEEPEGTVFQGTVIFSDSSELSQNAKVKIIGSGSSSWLPGVGTNLRADTLVDLNNNNQFKVSFPYIEKLESYSLGIDIYGTDGITIVDLIAGDDLDCSPYNCRELEPGKTYDLTIRVNR